MAGVSLQSLPAVILASIVIFIGAHNLSVFFRKPYTAAEALRTVREALDG